LEFGMLTDPTAQLRTQAEPESEYPAEHVETQVEFYVRLKLKLIGNVQLV